MSNVLSRAVGTNVNKEPVVNPAPVEGTSETHLNVFKHDMEDALQQIHAMVNEAELKYKALLDKLGV